MPFEELRSSHAPAVSPGAPPDPSLETLRVSRTTAVSAVVPRVAIPREEPYQRFDARDHSIFRGEATEYSEL